MNTIIPTTTFEPTELAFLQRVFNNACAERGLTGKSGAASDLAARIIELYQQGARNERDLAIQLAKSTLLTN
jgi:hypothetical protein